MNSSDSIVNHRRRYPVCDRCNADVIDKTVHVLKRNGKIRVLGHPNCMRDMKEKEDVLEVVNQVTNITIDYSGPAQ